MKFKVGDKVKMNNNCKFSGDYYVIQDFTDKGLGAFDDHSCVCADEGHWSFVGNAKPQKLPKFLLRYEIDSDPWEEFQTLTAVRKRIKELEEEGAHSYKVYEIASVKEVVISKRIEIK